MHSLDGEASSMSCEPPPVLFAVDAPAMVLIYHCSFKGWRNELMSCVSCRTEDKVITRTLRGRMD
jgi:hypothetical protein